MFNAFERKVAARYLRARRGERFVSVIAIFSLIGISLGVATLIIVMSVMNGFRQELLSQILGLNGDIGIYGANAPLTNYDDMAAKIRTIPGVTAAGTVIQPTQTIIHDQYGHTTVIVVPRRSYLDTGTEVSVGDRGFKDYMLPPTGDPGRQSWWFIGPDSTGQGQGFMPARPLYLPGYNPETPF